MRAACSLSLEQVRVVEMPARQAGPGEVVCRVLACGVCGSDVSAWVAGRLPAVLGHEVVGEVVAVGRDVDTVATGDRVVVHHHAPCGACAACASGHETLCARFRASGLDPGGYAEQVRVPADLVGELLPTALDPVVATFTEPLACVLRALDRARVGGQDRVLVVGCGSGGLLAVMAARVRGAGVWVAEPQPERLERAVAAGARAHAGEPVDVALVCSGAPAAAHAGFAALAPGGRLLLYATPGDGATLDFDAREHYVREIEVLASYSAGPADMRAALSLLEAGTIDPDGLVTHRLPLEQVGEALAVQRAGTGMKVVVTP